jgi:putative oxidoreductase
MKSTQLACRLSNGLTQFLDGCAPLFLLAIRIYFLKIFFWSGWLKTTSWSSTLSLFTNEYKIVGMTPTTAAYLGTAAELILPVLLFLGIGARLPAILLFIFNIFCVVFYPIMLTPEYGCALKDHILWGTLIAIIIFFGPGKLSVDYLLKKKVCPNYRY